jgi:hypothetical protein
LVLFAFNWYIFSGFGIRRQEKSGNPAWHVNDWANKKSITQRLDNKWQWVFV